MTAVDRQQLEHLRCCISHAFAAVGCRNPSSIAVVHASGGSRLSRELRGRVDFGGDARKSFYSDRALSLCPPIYEGDQCFTYSQLSLAVDSLSSRLRVILDGGDDPHLTRPSDDYRERSTSYSFVPSSRRLTESRDSYQPKVVGIYMPPSVEYIVTVLAVLRCEAAFLPIDPWWPKGRILSVISSSNVELIVGSRSTFGKSYDDRWTVESRSCPILLFSMEESLEEFQNPSRGVFPCECGKNRLFCYLMYTSGSTGNPKGVCGTEQGLLNRLLWMQEYYPLQGKERLLFKTSVSFIDHLQEFLGAVLTATMLVVPPFDELKENVFAIIDFLEAYCISRLTAVPSLMRAVVPALQSQWVVQVKNSLHLLVLSGEDFPVSLWKMLSALLPSTSILNLYGSTEVSGDCTFFDCKRLSLILAAEPEVLKSVPIGQPISKCNVVLAGENGTPDQGEIYVGGFCISAGWFSDSVSVHSEFVELQGFSDECSNFTCGSNLFFRTGDFARRLKTGDLVFLGRKDRIVKINGQRIALEEIENTLREHQDVRDAAVISCKSQGEVVFLEAFVLLKEKEKSGDMHRSLRHWLVDKVPQVMIPKRFVFLESFPLTSSGKVDYEFLAVSETMRANGETWCAEGPDLLQLIKNAFCDVLMVEEVSDEDDFFTIGGNSVAAAHVSHNLGINMKMLYDFPSPAKLQNAILHKVGSHGINLKIDTASGTGLEDGKRKTIEFDTEANQRLMEVISGKGGIHGVHVHDVHLKRLKDGYTDFTFEGVSLGDGYQWRPLAKHVSFSLSRCNRVMYEPHSRLKDGYQASWSANIPRNVKSFIRRLWKVQMESCVDASPLVVVQDQEIYIFIGSHAHKFVCVNAKSGFVQWETNLDGRIESSAAITGDFSQIVVGCYKGKIYFLDFSTGKIRWNFQTAGEVKSQPVFDRERQLIWCGSHDCILYALDYKNYQCIFHITCGGSIFGSPAVDELHRRIYVASTSGLITALSVKVSPFYVLWQHELEVPVFGSICLCPHSGNVICCLVDGSIIALDSSGATTWRIRTGSPIFAGACISSVLPFQVLICSRSGKVFSFETENGRTIWEYNVGDPITASAFVEENLQLMSDRLVCVCTCSGSVVLLRVKTNVADDMKKDMVEEFARLELQGEVFSSPVMIDGVIFVGCRDDYLHCLAVETQSLLEE